MASADNLPLIFDGVPPHVDEEPPTKKVVNDDDCSVGMSAVSSGTESEEKKAPEETDGCGVAAAAANKADTGSTNSSGDVSMPWVKDLPNHLLAPFFQRMPPTLKRQVEMTTQRMAEIMKVHGWRKWHNIDILITEDSSGSFRVNDSIDVHGREVIDCVQFLLSRIPIRRFSLKQQRTRSYKLLTHLKDVSNALLDALVESKDDGVAIKELRLDVPAELLKSSTFGEVITAFCETLTHISTPIADATVIDAIGKCDRLEALAFTDGGWLGYQTYPLRDAALKNALATKSSLTSLLLGANYRPFNILTAGVHHINHLAIKFRYQMDEEPTDDQTALLSNLEILEIKCFEFSNRVPAVLNLLRTAPKLRRLHFLSGDWIAFPYDTDPGGLFYLLKHLAEECYRLRRSLTVSGSFSVEYCPDPDDDEVVSTSNDDQGALASMMKNSTVWMACVTLFRQLVTYPDLSHYGVTAFDERLHAFDPNLKPSTTESPPLITSIDGSRVYKRLFTIDVRPGVRLSVGFDEQLNLTRIPTMTGASFLLLSFFS